MAYVTQTTGIEESRVRYYEVVFRDLFKLAGVDVNCRVFDERRIEILRQIEWLRLDQRLPDAEIRRRLQVQFTPTSTPIAIAITSGKGGVGKTTIAVNLALAFAHLGRRTLLVDADLGLANVHVYAGLTPRHTLAGLVTGSASPEQVLNPWIQNLDVICGDSGIAHMASTEDKWSDLVSRALQPASAGYEVMVLDTAAGISPAVVQFLGLAHAILLVATPNIASILDAYGVIKVARQQGLASPFHVLVNRTKGETQAAGVYQSISTCTQRFMGFEPCYLGHLPEDEQLETANQHRHPLMLSHPEAATSGLFVSLAAALYNKHKHSEVQHERTAPLPFHGG